MLIRHLIYWLKVDFIPECARKNVEKKKKIDSVASFVTPGETFTNRDSWWPPLTQALFVSQKTQLSNPK